jgi:DNA repair photolyase
VFDPDVLLALVGPLRPGDTLAPGVTLTAARAGTRLTLHLDDHGVAVIAEVAPRTTSDRAAAETEHFALSYRATSGLSTRRGQELCRLLAGRVALHEAEVASALRAAADEAPTTRLRSVHVARALEPYDVPGSEHYGLSPYVGCLIGCRYCYAQSRLSPVRGLLGRAGAPWGSWVDVRSNLPEVLALELRTAPPRPVKLTPILSDPYQALESLHRLTRRCLAILSEVPAFIPLVLTRSVGVLEDLGLIAGIRGAHVGVSLPSLDEAVLRHFEPRAATAAQRLAVLGDFSAAGVTTFAVVQPMLPGPVEELAEVLAERVQSVHLGLLHGVEAAGGDFADVRFSMSREPEWQRVRARQLAEALEHRGVLVWTGELPPTLRTNVDVGQAASSATTSPPGADMSDK